MKMILATMVLDAFPRYGHSPGSTVWMIRDLDGWNRLSTLFIRIVRIKPIFSDGKDISDS